MFLDKIILVQLLATVAWAKFITDLEIDNHPCKAENLKKSTRYICDSQGNVICQKGWKNPDAGFNRLEVLNPCLEPICEDGCVHGQCKEPNLCACEIGWTGRSCEECITLPNCVHGKCHTNPFECICEDGWTGANCDIAACDGGCGNGNCVEPGKCVCADGWRGDHCDECTPRRGCQHGTCDEPGTCVCKPHWEGYLCDRPSCSEPCQNGICKSIVYGDNVETFCICENGWKGPQCDECRPYWKCPNQDTGACDRPNECLCDDASNPLCNNPLLSHSYNNVTSRSHFELGLDTEAHLEEIAQADYIINHGENIGEVQAEEADEQDENGSQLIEKK